MVMSVMLVSYLTCHCDKGQAYLSRSSILLLISAFASSGDPFNLINILQFDVHVLCIFPCFSDFVLSMRFQRWVLLSAR